MGLLIKKRVVKKFKTKLKNLVLSFLTNKGLVMVQDQAF